MFDSTILNLIKHHHSHTALIRFQLDKVSTPPLLVHVDKNYTSFYLKLDVVNEEPTTVKNPEFTPATHLSGLIAYRAISAREKAQKKYKKREQM